MKQFIVYENGILYLKENKNIISKTTVYNFIKKNNLTKIAPGIYANSEVIIDESFILSIRCPKGIISHEDALYYHGLIDREPIMHSITIYTSYNPSRLSDSGYKVYTIKKELLDIGKMTIINNFGNEIPIYDLERTICDLFRNRNSFEIQDFNVALKHYISKPEKDLIKLMKYAKLFKIDKIVRQYLEVLI